MDGTESILFVEPKHISALNLNFSSRFQEIYFPVGVLG